jgi:sugar O-acyltransferase (sialic acid O-acetyltransferase NeuD family)
MIDVIMIGAGGHAAEIAEYIKYNQSHTGKKDFNLIGFLDDNPQNYARYQFTVPLIGGLSNYRVIKDHFYIIGIAGLQFRRPIVDHFIAEGAKFVSFIHCGAYISESAKIGEGTIIGPNVNIGPNVHLGNHNLINARSSLGHDTVVGNCNIISPNVCLSGFTQVGDENLFGINSATIPGIKIGSHNKIAAGMILDTNIGDDTVVFHRFKERIIAVPKL